MKTIVKIGSPLPFCSAEQWGGKGKNLLELGGFFNVPSGIVLAVDTFHSFVNESKLESRIQDALALTGEEAEQKIKEAFLGGQHPQALADEIEKQIKEAGLAFPLAVRSSATDEDGMSASFAGQHESILGLSSPHEVIKAIKEVYASLYTARAIAYRQQRGLPNPQGIAIVIQDMINPDVAGVAYSASPTDLNYILVEATYGLGTSVVDGRGVDSFKVLNSRYAQPKIETRKINKHKNEKKIYDPKQRKLVTEAVDASLRDKPCLTDSQVFDISALAIEVEGFFTIDGRKPQDIEWAISNSGLFLLQSRPITGMDINTPDINLPALSKLVGETYNVGRKGEYEGPVVVMETVDCNGSHFTVKGGEDIRKLNEKYKDGYILVTPETNPTLDSYLTNCKAIVATECGIMSHAGATARERDMIFLGCVESTDKRRLIDILNHGDRVVVAANKQKGILGYR